MTLGERLRREIATRGPIGFDRYMRDALLDPVDGFYGRGARLGDRGAFQTGPTLNPAFAEAVAREVAAAAEALGSPIDLVEVGPGDGSLLDGMRLQVARDVARVVLVEPARGMREQQESRLAGLPVTWVDDVSEVPPLRGIAIANEVFDALPVRLLRWPDEVLVGLDALERFAEVSAPAPPELTDAVLASGVTPIPGAGYAVCLDAPGLLASLAGVVEGRILIIDYGGEGDEVHGGRRAPVRTYVQGQPGGDPLRAPGRQDLTADVDFGTLRATAAALGLRELLYAPQDRWLVDGGVTLPARALRSDADWALARLIESRLSFRVLLLESS